MILVPSVSIGNVPQLAFDLLIHTYNFELEATLEDEFMYPISGPVDHAPGTQRSGITTPIQVFKKGEIELVQLRSPPLPNCRSKFLEYLAQTLKGDFLVVGSANAGMRLDALDGGKLVETSASDLPQDIQEAGFFTDAVKKFNAQGLLLYTYEGDNVGNAIDVAKVIAHKLGLEEKQWVQPISWSRLYGKDVPGSMEDGIYA